MGEALAEEELKGFSDTGAAAGLGEVAALLFDLGQDLLVGVGRAGEVMAVAPLQHGEVVEKLTWKGEGYSPTHSLSFTKVTRFQLRGSSEELSKTATLLARRLFIMTRWLPDGLKPVSWMGFPTEGRVTSQVSGLPETFLTGQLSARPSLAMR